MCKYLKGGYITMTKICPKCEHEKDRSEFYTNKASLDGLTTYCKKCDYKKTKEYIDNHKDERNEYYRKKYAEDSTGSKKAQKKWNEKNRESRLKYFKGYREENLEKFMRSRLICGARERSKKKNLDFNIDYEWIDEQLSKKCPRTGWDFVYEANSPRKPSIDRIDSSKGYTKDNCQLVCVIYNYAKNMWTDKDVILLAEALLNK
jgi:hypothetical protein